MWPFTGVTGRRGARDEERLFHHLGYFSWYALGVVWAALIIVWSVMVIHDFRPASVARYANGRVIAPWDISFPAVTLCPQYKTALPPSLLGGALNGSNVLCDRGIAVGGTDEPETAESKPENNFLNEMVICKFQKVVGCNDIFRETITSSGKCYTFNEIQYWSNYSALRNAKSPRAKDWSPDEGYNEQAKDDAIPARSNPMNGIGTGLQVVLLHRPTTRNCSTLSSIKVQIHNPAQVPLMDRDYFTLPVNKEVTLAVNAHRIWTDKEVFQFPHTRACYFAGERKLAYFTVYTQANCELECLANYTLQHCRCVPSYLPRNDSTKVCDQSTISYNCYTQAEEDLKNSRQTNNSEHMFKPECDCKKDCSIDKYRAEYATWKYYWRELLINSSTWYASSMLAVYIRDQAYVDTYELTAVYHPMRGYGDFIFILCCLTFLLMIVVTTSLVKGRVESESTDRALKTLKSDQEEEGE